MSAAIIVRPARPGDARGIARVHVETWRSAYAGMLPDRVMVDMRVDDKAAYWRRAIERKSRRDVILVVAVHTGAGRGDIVGFVSGGPAESGSLPYDGEVQMLYVQPDWQDRGIGGALLGHCFGAMRKRGMRSAFLWVVADNPARFFYEAMGGQRVGERDESLWGAVVHEAAYAWPDLSLRPQTRRFVG